MARLMKVRRPRVREIQQLCKRIVGLTDPHQRRRAEVLILYGMGLKPLEIAMSQGVHPNTVYKDLHDFEQLGLEAIEQLHCSGARSRITGTQVTEMVQLAEQSPQEVGLPYGRWSLRKLSAYLVKKHIVKSIGRERLRQLLKKRSALQAGSAQAPQPRPTAARNFGSPPLDFRTFARPRASLVFRCQTDCRQSLWRTTLYIGQASGAFAQPKNTRAVLPVRQL